MEGTQQNVTVQTPFGISQNATLSSGKIGNGAFPRFDSRHVEEYAERIIATSLPQLREDASGTAAFARELEHIFKEVLKVEFPKLRATEFIPLNTEVPPGSLTCTFRMWQQHGVAQVIHNYAANLPKASQDAKEFPSPIITIGSSYDFSIVDIQRAALTGAPLEQMLADAARFAIEFLGEQIAAVGSSADNVPGLTNAANVTATTQVSTGGWLTQMKALGSATASAPAEAVAAIQGIISDVTAMIFTIEDTTKLVHSPTNMLVPHKIYSMLRRTPRSPAFTNDNMLDYVEEMTGLEVDPWVQLDALGSGSTGRVMVYEKDPLVLRLIQAQPFTQLPPQPLNLAWQVPCLSQLGGVNVIRPKAITYMDGVNT